MFAGMDTFTFDRTSRQTERTTTTHRECSRSVSPCSSAANAAAMNDSRFTLTDLAAQFAGQRLRRDAQICYDSCEVYANLDDDAGWHIEVDDAEDESDSCPSTAMITPFPIATIPLSRRRTCPPRPHSPSQRMQRQVNARLLCSTAHTRDIADLVAKMVKSQDQCSVASAPGLSASPSTTSLNSVSPSTPENNEDALDEDEGYDSGSGSSSTTSRRTSIATRSSSSTSLPALCMSGYSRSRSDVYRRASDRRHAPGASVCKSARFRRESRLSHSRS